MRGGIQCRKGGLLQVAVCRRHFRCGEIGAEIVANAIRFRQRVRESVDAAALRAVERPRNIVEGISARRYRIVTAIPAWMEGAADGKHVAQLVEEDVLDGLAPRIVGGILERGSQCE